MQPLKHMTHWGRSAASVDVGRSLCGVQTCIPLGPGGICMCNARGTPQMA